MNRNNIIDRIVYLAVANPQSFNPSRMHILEGMNRNGWAANNDVSYVIEIKKVFGSFEVSRASLQHEPESAPFIDL